MRNFFGNLDLSKRQKFDPFDFKASSETEVAEFIKIEKLKDVSSKNAKFMNLVGKAKTAVADLVHETSPSLATKIRSSIILDKKFQTSVREQKKIDNSIKKIQESIKDKPNHKFLKIGLNSLSLIVKTVNELSGPTISSTLNRKAITFLRSKEEQLIPLNKGLKQN